MSPRRREKITCFLREEGWRDDGTGERLEGRKAGRLDGGARREKRGKRVEEEKERRGREERGMEKDGWNKKGGNEGERGRCLPDFLRLP